MMRTARPRSVTGIDRPSALTTPAVTVPVRPSGLPTATTSCPTCSRFASPSRAGAGVFPDARTTARSEITRKPSPVKMTAEPVPRDRSCESVMVTAATEGPTVAATVVTTVE